MALIILGHPAFEKSLANKAIIDALTTNLSVEIRHIQQLYPDYTIDVKAEQDALLRHQNIVFQYPFYWYNVPAILKHWFDVVFAHQFAYGSRGDKLKGKNFIPSFTIGGLATEYHTVGEHHFRVFEFCKNLEQTAYYAQMNYIDPFYFHGTSLNAGYTEEEIKGKANEQAKNLIALLQKLDQNAVA